ncbi:double zinc ribbon domain-containing protein, partial [Legionella sp.]|uniref:double zinc ribbon domain-containing protein n=1 Tax=Legionella sp. TaxID=459 RepID=UPI003CC63A41
MQTFQQTCTDFLLYLSDKLIFCGMLVKCLANFVCKSHHNNQEKLGSPTFLRQKLFIVTQSLRLPSICILCNQFHKGSLAVCKPCIKFMPQLGSACQHCALPLPTTTYLVCG